MWGRALAAALAASGAPGRRLDGLSAGDECDLKVGEWANKVDEDDDGQDSTRFWVGVILSIVADATIAVSLNIQKLAHNKNQGPDGEPLMSYLKIPHWWAGITLNVFGEVGNMLAYGFAPAAVVAPVGSVGVFFNEIIAVVFLKEPFRRRDALGLLFVIMGVVLIILGVPEDNEQLTAHLVLSDQYYSSPRAYGYLIALGFLIAGIIIFLEPKYARHHILVWLILCSVISSVTVIASRGFSSMLTGAGTDCGEESCIHGHVHAPCMQTLGHWSFYLLLVVIIVTAVWSAMYLQRAMMVFGNTETVPVYYCTFTLASIIGGAVVYNEFAHIEPLGFVQFGLGVSGAIGGVMCICSGRAAEGEKDFKDMTPEEKLAPSAENRRVSITGGAGGAALAQFMTHDVVVGNKEQAAKISEVAHKRRTSALPFLDSLTDSAGAPSAAPTKVSGADAPTSSSAEGAPSGQNGDRGVGARPTGAPADNLYA